ncbi:hypothetical protein H9P43_007600 [Blastocladiella emersonii ATCC 22665]|nr:hypothetical protein H9P43_007600 [Blastocladiella emersonii ATCC 22665]
MTSYIRFIPLSGARSERGVCGLLELDDAKILLDCGWTGDLDPADLSELEKHASDIDCVLLSHGSLRHCGGLAYAAAKLGLTCPVYATFPVQTMARHTVHDALMTRKMKSGYAAFTRRDVDVAFNRVTLLRYSQPVGLAGKAQGTLITAFSAGHSVGGTIWKIKNASEEVVYAMDINHRRDTHLSPTELFQGGNSVLPALARPSLLIAGCRTPPGTSIKTRDDALVHSALDTLKTGGNVVIPVDTASRVLELAHVLEERWKHDGISYPIVVLSHTAPRVMHSARGMLEWYAKQLTQAFSQSRVQPFDFTYVKLAASWDDLRKHPDPKLVLASDEDLDLGFSRQVFLDHANAPRHLVLLPGRPREATLARAIYDEVKRASPSLEEIVDVVTDVEVREYAREPLEGDELKRYLAARDTQREREARVAAELAAQNKSIIEADLSDEDDDEDDDAARERRAARKRKAAAAAAAADGAEGSEEATAAAAVKKLKKDAAAAAVVQFAGYDAYVRGNPRARFPFAEHRRRFDEYGEVVKQDHYLTDADRMEREREAAARKRAEAAAAERDGTGRVVAEAEELMDVDSEDAAPTKDVTRTVTVRVNVRARVVDFAGLSDADALANILSLVHARAIAFTGASDADTDGAVGRITDALAELNTDEAATVTATAGGDAVAAVHAPKVGDAVALSATNLVAHVKLTDALFTGITMHRYGKHEIGAVTAVVRPAASSAAIAPAAGGGGGATSSVAVLDVVDDTAARRHPAVVIGTVRLAEFKAVLDAHALDARFERGVLVVNDKIAVYKTANGDLALHGPVCREYDTVRRLLYAQHVVL